MRPRSRGEPEQFTMYKQHFGLSSEIFHDGIARDGDVYCGPRQQVLAANLTIALTRRDSVAVIYGAPGVGKTTTVSHALREMTTRLALGTLAHAPATAHELLEALLTEFGFQPYKNSRTERLQIWRQFLSEMAVTETRVCVLVENTQDLEVEILKSLDGLTAADANGCPGANLVLTAASAPEQLLIAPALASLRQRMRLQTTLAPLTVEETRDYLEFRTKAAGADYDRVFAPDAAAAAHAFSGGLIRVINNMVESALSIAATRREPLLTAQLLTRVAVGLFGIPAAQVAAYSSGQGAEPSAVEAASAAEQRGLTEAEADADADDPAPSAVEVTEDGPAPIEADAAPNPEAPIEADTAANLEAPVEAASTANGAPPSVAKPAPARPPRIEVDAGMTVDADPHPPVTSPGRDDAMASVATKAQTGSRNAPTAAGTDVERAEPSPQPAAASGTKAGAEVRAPIRAPAALPTAKVRAEVNEKTNDGVPLLDDVVEDVPVLTDSVVFAAEPPGVPSADLVAAEPERKTPPQTDEALDIPDLDDAVEADAGESKHEERDELDELDELELDDILSAALDDAVTTPAARPDVSAVADEDEADDMLDIPELEEISEPDAFDLAVAMSIESSETNATDEDAADESDSDDLSELQADDLMEAFANAKALEDISNSMAETLFGDEELEQLAATLAIRAGSANSGADDEDEPAVGGVAGGTPLS